MEERWWERPVCFICDYWWMILLALLFILSLFFTRTLWLPALGISSRQMTQTISSIEPTSLIKKTSTNIPATARSNSSVTPIFSVPQTRAVTPLSGYINAIGSYGFNYPSNWQGAETGTDVLFIVDNIKIDVAVHDPQKGKTLDSIRSGSDPLPSSTDDFNQTTVAGESALRQNLSGYEGQFIGYVYHVFSQSRYYTLTVVANPTEPLPDDFTDILMQFESLVKSFRFLS